MATDEEYLRQIRKYKTHKKLLRLWGQILQRATPGWDAGKALEYLVLRAFEIEGADVRWPFGVELDTHLVEQIDGVVYTANVNCMAESKDWTIPIPIEPIAKLRNQLLRRPAGVVGAVFTTSPDGFTPAAATLARFLAPQTILLWRRQDIEFALRQKLMVDGLLRKYRHAVEHGLPDLLLEESE